MKIDAFFPNLMKLYLLNNSRQSSDNTRKVKVHTKTSASLYNRMYTPFISSTEQY